MIDANHAAQTILCDRLCVHPAYKDRVPHKVEQFLFPFYQRQQEDELLAERIHQVYQANHQIYGSRRIRAELADQGLSCGRKRVVRLMRNLQLRSRPRRHRTVTTDSQHSDPVAANLLDRDFTAEAPNTKWVTDITGVWTAEGCLYVFALVLRG